MHTQRFTRLAHDINNMLAVIIGHAELALDHVDEQSPLREHLLQIQQAGQRSSELTREVLLLAREPKEKAPEPKPRG